MTGTGCMNELVFVGGGACYARESCNLPEEGMHPETQRLEEVVADLRQNLGVQEAQMSERCRLAAREEGKVVEQRLDSKRLEACTHIERLEEHEAVLSEDLAHRESQLLQVEQRLEETEKREQRLQEWDSQRIQMKSRLLHFKGQHHASFEKFRADFKRSKSVGDELEAQFEGKLLVTQRKVEKLMSANEAQEAAALRRPDHLRVSLAIAVERLTGLETSVADMRELAVEKGGQVESLIEQGIQLTRKAEELDNDTVLQSRLVQSERRASELACKSSRLREVDVCTEDFVVQLQDSSQLVLDIQAAMRQSRAQVDIVQVEPPPSWPEERVCLHAQLSAMDGANQRAMSGVSKCCVELRELRTDAASDLNVLRDAAATEMAAATIVSSARPGQFAPSDVDVLNARDAGDADTTQLVNAEADVSKLEDLLQHSRAQLDAKGRRLQLNARGRDDIGSLDVAHVDDCLRVPLASARKRAADLEKLAVDLGMHLDDKERELVMLQHSYDDRESVVP